MRARAISHGGFDRAATDGSSRGLARRPSPPERPLLRLVADPAVVARARRRRRLLTGITATIVVCGLFAVVGLQVLLTQGQGQLDALEVRVNAEQEQHQRLRLHVAQLEAPSRVVEVARARLGMEPVSEVTYLAPLPSSAPE